MQQLRGADISPPFPLFCERLIKEIIVNNYNQSCVLILDSLQRYRHQTAAAEHGKNYFRILKEHEKMNSIQLFARILIKNLLRRRSNANLLIKNFAKR